jgi:hypothetical protein
MAGRKPFQQAVLAVLIAGAAVFVLLLAGAGSGVLTKPAPYTPPPPGVITTP